MWNLAKISSFAEAFELAEGICNCKKRIYASSFSKII